MIRPPRFEHEALSEVNDYCTVQALRSNNRICWVESTENPSTLMVLFHKALAGARGDDHTRAGCN
ncbi:MAG TPA: hypothetical protein DCE18_11715 [Syntrophobacteraceae bacterium]|nr:hypothetical protein [Syntrophobacteraceae bacterium]